MGSNKAPAARLGRHLLAPPPPARRFFRRRPGGHFLCRHCAAEFERLVEIVGKASRIVTAIAEIDAILAGQALEGKPEGAQLGAYHLKP